jgi:tetratricopeptide (TPR) repeat protein
MSEFAQLHNRFRQSVVTTLTLILATAGTLVGLPSGSLRAQQDRQLVQPGSTNANNGKRIALVIGNGAYTNAPPLKNPPNDARDMAATLKALGFEVSSGVNLSQREMKRLIREFGQKLKGGGNGLFYYAGHGVQARGRNYIIPVDADIQSEADVEDSGVDVGLVLNYMDDAQNGLNIVVLDACRNNPFARSFRSASDGLAQVDAPTGTLIAYATAPGRVAADGAGANGLYTSELLKAMHVPGLSATDMFMQVRAEVMKRTGNKQVPWEASSLVGSFYFSGAPTNSSAANVGSGTAAPGETKFDAAAFEYNYWDSIKNSTSVDDFKAYLAKYPEGQFAALAKNRIKNLEVPTKRAELEPTSRNSGAAEIAFWDSVKNSANPEDFQAYLKKYPNGEFAELANNRLRSVTAALRAKERDEGARRTAEEIERQTKTFRISYGYKMALAEKLWGATLKVSPDKFEIIADDSKVNVKWNCDSFDAATLDNDWIREISCGVGKCRIKAASASEATSALESVRQACAAPRKRWQEVETESRSRLALAMERTGPRHGWLGVFLSDISPEVAAKLRIGFGHGAVVVSTAPGSPAEQAGIKPEDVITAFQGSPVSDYKSFTKLISNTPVDTEVDLMILRDGREQPVRVRLGVLSVEDEQVGLQSSLGYALLMQEKWAEGEAAYREASRLKPNEALYHYNLGVALENQKKLAEAEVQYREAVHLAPAETTYQETLRRVQKALKK